MTDEAGKRRGRDVLDDEPWVAGDGTNWLYFPQFREWHGWEPYEEEKGLYVYGVAEFRRWYPDAPPWDTEPLCAG
jgi:hypothetical protein